MVYRPNSNTFVAHMARKCGLAVPRLNRPGRNQAVGIHTNVERYLEFREGWLEKRRNG